MRIDRKTPDELVVLEEPWLLAVIFCGFVLALAFVLLRQHDEMSLAGTVGLAAMTAVCAGVGSAVVRRTRVALSKATGRIAFETTALVGAGRRVVSLRHLLEARVDMLSDANGDTSRLVFAFSDAMADELDPVERARMERLKRRGLRRARITEIPLTIYFSSGDEAERIAAEINAWAKAG